MQLQYRLLQAADEVPYELLLLADPSRKMIDDYLKRGDCYLVYAGEQLVGEYVLIWTHPKTIEIVNIAVKEHYHGQGIGKAMMGHAIDTAKQMGAETLEIGTGNSSFRQLRMYQMCGFRMNSIDTDFFVRHYEEPLYEDGLLIRDMVRLRMDLTEYIVNDC